MIRFLLIQACIGLSTMVLTAQVQVSVEDQDTPSSTLYKTEVWKQLQPGNVYQGHMKLDPKWTSHWAFQWMKLGDHAAFTKVPENWAREQYFSKQKTPHIYDPQHYLAESERKLLIEILNTHEKSSMIPIHLCIFCKNQRTEHIEPEKMARFFLENKTAALMYYFIGDATATMGFVNISQEEPVAHETATLPDAFLIKSMFSKAGSYAASQKVDEKEAMYATLAEVSRRMYWIEHELGLVKSTDALLKEDKTETKKETKPSKLDTTWQQLLDYKNSLTFFSTGILIAIGAVLLSICLMLYRRVKVYQFPLYQGSKRLGAEFGAGVGRVVHFKSARHAPQQQKKKLLEDNEI